MVLCVDVTDSVATPEVETFGQRVSTPEVGTYNNLVTIGAYLPEVDTYNNVGQNGCLLSSRVGNLSQCLLEWVSIQRWKLKIMFVIMDVNCLPQMWKLILMFVRMVFYPRGGNL